MNLKIAKKKGVAKISCISYIFLCNGRGGLINFFSKEGRLNRRITVDTVCGVIFVEEI